MAFEILNSATITPHRLHAMVRLIPRLKNLNPSRNDVLNMLQPEILSKNQNTSADVYKAARHCNLIQESEGEGVVSLVVDQDQIETFQNFQRQMQRILTGITDEQENNHLLNIYTAWYAVQNESILTYTRKDFESHFNKQVYPGEEDRQFNTTKFNGWRTWAAFLGWGRLMKKGTFDILVPDATLRIEPLLGCLLPDGEQLVSFGAFVQNLAATCPELDGGVLFNYCWKASRGAEQRGTRLSLMLSTALRVLHNLEQIELVRQADASYLWQLYPAMGHPVQEVSHIRRRNI